ncbi:MAG: cytochrome C [Proteobacteria bacterium]|nr:cytochrome C [Pseudomonadota bacterium]MBU1709441.1 cytochrome C [Pseudomonadota bacterium]
MRKELGIMLVCAVLLLLNTSHVFASAEKCISCHKDISPGQVMDWEASKHSKEDVTCSTCHGDKHNDASDAKMAAMPDEAVCAGCHEDQFNQFSKGKHNFGWTSLNAMPVTHVEPDELMEGGRGCGGCHNMGIKSEAQKKEQLEKGYHYQNNSCDECHTRHSFSKKEALNPRACQQCHMGYDHPQWEMWSSSKHGTRYLSKEVGDLPETAAAPKCQDCHMQNGNHENRTAWGFLGVRLPLPEDKQWAADRVVILKALGVLNPETGEPTARLDAVKAVDLARLTEEAWSTERNKMIKVCTQCHSETYAREQLAMGDSIMQKADRLMADAIEIVAGLYKDGIIKKPKDYAFAYPDLLYFMRTSGSDINHMSHIDQALFEMYMKHRMRTYQAFFHINPDYAYWYGWAMMTKELGKIQELAQTMRATHK